MSRRDAGPDLLAELRERDSSTTGALFPLVYAELRRLAHHYLSRERPGHTLQATALVHEVYLRLIPQGDATWEDRAKFVGIAAHVMREILVEYARSRNRVKRGGEHVRVPLQDDVAHIDADLGFWEDLDRSANDAFPFGVRFVPMTPLTWAKVTELFEQAIDLAPEARGAFLTELGVTDAAAATELASLLEAHDRPGEFLPGLDSGQP